MTEYEYDPDLPYVVTYRDVLQGRFATFDLAHRFVRSDDRLPGYRISDTTPKPRVPEDAQFITWMGDGYRLFAWPSDLEGRWFDDTGSVNVALEDLPGVTPDTVFTVLDERKS